MNPIEERRFLIKKKKKTIRLTITTKLKIPVKVFWKVNQEEFITLYKTE